MTAATDSVGGGSPMTAADEVREEFGEVVGYVRSPSDVLRVVGFALSALMLLGVTRWATDAVTGIEEAIVGLLDLLSPTAERVLSSLGAVAVIVVGIVVLALPFALRRFRLLGYIVAGNVLTAALVGGATWWLDRSLPPGIVNEIAERAGLHTDDVVSPTALASLAASFVILGPFVTRRWRRVGVVTLVAFTLLRITVSAHLPAEVFLALAIGGTAGAAVLLAFGRPDQRPTAASVRTGLEQSGLALASLERASVDARGSTPYFATLADGSRVFAKALSPQERAADLLFRAYRYLRFKNVGDGRPFSSLRRTVEHEALVSLRARDVGVRTPRLRAIADLGGDAMLLAYDLIDGRSLDRLDDDAVTDDLLCRLWEQVALLHRHRIAHRDLRRANVFVDTAGDPWIIDFGFSEVAASDALLDADVAQFLAALSIKVGATRAVENAVGVLGVDAVANSLPRLQAAALSGATRESLKQQPGLLKELQRTVVERCGIDEPHYEPIARFSAKSVFVIVMLAAVTYFLLPQLADLPGIVDQVKDADWAWFPAVVAMSALTYVGAALSFLGAVPDRLRAGPTFVAQVASSFVSKLAPAGLGGMGLNVRYLQKAGVDPAVGVSSVGLNTVGGFAMHMILLVSFVTWAGRSAFGSIELPDPHVFLYGVLAVLVLAGAAFAIPTVRTQVTQKFFPMVRRSLGGFAAVLRRPGKLALLLGGSGVVTLTYIFAVYFSTQAFGGDLGFAQVGAIYLTGATVATAAPTPGGLGALEAALVAGLVAAGMDNTVAVPAVFMYRLATFWLPILPGWACFTYLRRAEYV